MIVDGVNIAARLGPGQALSVLSEFARAAAELSRGRRERTTLPLQSSEEAWEVGLLADGGDALISVYRLGSLPAVALHERRVDLVALRAAITRAIDQTELAGVPAGMASTLAGARRLLELPWPSAIGRPIERVPVRIAPRANAPLTFSAETLVYRPRRASDAGVHNCVERADLHSLLVLGKIAATARERSVRLLNVYPFLFAERLVSLAEEALDAWRGERALVRRVTLDGAQLRLERGTGDARLAFTLTSRDARRDLEGVTLVEIETPSFVRAAVEFALTLVNAFIEADPSQEHNLRLKALTRQASELSGTLSDLTHNDSLTNPEPENYRTFGLPRTKSARGLWEHGGKMRFTPRWVATVPNIDLRATFHCGDKIVVGSQNETTCIESSTGRVLWRHGGPRASSVATPLGIVRIQPEGLIELVDLELGDVRFSTRVAPRAAGGATGALVNAPGLPRLLVVTEGDRSVTAIDLCSGDVRWRYNGRGPASYRLRRAGKLLLVAGGDSALVALDVVSGEVVWRLRDKLAFSGEITVDKDSAYALAGGPLGPAKLFHVNLWSGKLLWSRELDERPVLGQTPLVVRNRVVIPVRDRRGLGALAFEPTSGRLAWTHEPGLASSTTAWLAVDDTLIANSASGVLLCIEGETGQLRYNHVFSRQVEADQPRRLEPVLRNGALFVPQHQVHVVRPRDGELIGAVPSDIIPDLLRVDEHCSVYIAEESGHFAAFGTAPKLTLVR